MDKDARILTNLIENLEDIKGKLSSIDYEKKWIDCILPKKKSRSYVNLKNVLESLVMKTVEGKGYDEDIASICNHHKPFLEKHLQFQNLFSSEEYLIEAANLPKMPLRFEFLHSSLTTFQDFLGDILHSICQISSCQLKLPSKILVKDLLKLKNQYLSIWDLISTVFGETKCRRDSDCSLIGDSKGIKSQVSEIQYCLQMCLKEMSRVKLEIEHYFKCNLIEVQFTKCSNDADSGESVHSKKEVLGSNKGSDYSLLKEISSSLKQIASHKNTCISSTRKQLSNLALSSPSFTPTEAQSYETESKEDSNNSGQSCPLKNETWNDISNSFIETPYGDFFQKPIIFPPNLLFLDPTTFLIQSKNDVQKINSLPKIYSVDSFNENNNKELKSGTSQKNDNNTFNTNMCNNVKVQKFEEIPPIKSLIEDDLQCHNKSKNENQTGANSKCLQEKMSTLFEMLQSPENVCGEEDIFRETPLKIEGSNFSYSQKVQKYNNLKINNDKENIAQRFSSLKKSNCIPEKRLSGNKNNENTCVFKSKVNFEVPFYFGGLKENYKIDKLQTKTEEVIFDKQSLIELYHTEDANQEGLNTGSTPGEQSTLSLWPVTAEYIHVSKSKRPLQCDSVSSDSSIPLSKSFGKSFYSLHLNKRYEQKQFYDGDLLVLENQERSMEQASSSFSLLNQSHYVFDKEENFKPFEKLKGTQNVCYGKFDNKMQLSQNKNLQSHFKKGRDLNSKRKTLKDVKKTLAVHYKDCGDSFKVTDKSFNRENFDFLKVNGYDVRNNWNSFISIFTSKVGPTAQINHHRMFRKVINTITTDSVTCSNVYGNVHTLISNGGPFRLFDINGYPLTDSAGNVLKDPYGKSVVTLDSTGFPKDDIKVFDAAGNSPNEINFDPTQKPKTNSIIIKLTDNFKRPLHLFDKYGRPLTDSCGKLLVNIHGRPLLRFDNFGRPNTDYRGGPLYTDNGYRWSYKTGDPLSSTQLSNESLMQKKISGFLENESRKNSYENFGSQNKSGDNNKNTFENVETRTAEDKKDTILNPSKSDIWTKVESVLLKLPKNKKVDPKASQTSVIINNVTIKQNPIEKEFLKSIIYHNNIIQQDVNHFNTIHSQFFTNHKAYLDFKNVNNCLVDKTPADKNRTNPMGKVLNADEFKPYYSTTPFPFQNNIFLKNACSKCLKFDNLQHIPSNKFLNNQCFKLGKTFTCDADDFLRNPIATTLTSYTKKDIKNKESYLTFKNHDYLNNLCNQILKHEINYSDKTKILKNPEIFKKNNNWTDSSYTEFPSSIASKYTTGFTTHTESPVYFSDTSTKNQLQGISIQKKYYNSFLNKQQPLDCYKIEKDALNKDRNCCCGDYQIKNKKHIEHMREKSRYSSNEHKEDQFQNESELSLQKPNSDTMSIKILNKDDKHYEIKVTEMLSKIVNPKLNFGFFSTGKNNHEKHNLICKPSKRKLEMSSKNNLNTENPTNMLIKKNNTESYKEKANNSLFRFSSDEIIESIPTSERYTKASYLQKTIHESDSNVCRDSFNAHHAENKHLTDQTNQNFTNVKMKNENTHEGHFINPLAKKVQSRGPESHKKDQVRKNNNTNRRSTYPIKKPVSSNRECNLVSFFGSPVKYVLNKLDGKRSLKQNQFNTFVKKKTEGNSRENIKKSHNAAYSENKAKTINEIKIQTLYDICKSSKKSMLSSSEKAEIKGCRNRASLNEQDTLLAFKSKSYTGLVSQDNDVLMCYSGDSQRSNRKKLSQDFTLSSKKLQKSMSATSYITVERYGDSGSMQHSSKYEHGKKVPKIGQNSLKPNITRKKNIKLDYKTQRNYKSQKGSSGRNSKSPLFSSRTKAKEISLFKKVEPEGKYMLKIKR